MAGQPPGKSGGGFVDAVTVGCAGPARAVAAPRRKGRLAMLDDAGGGPITVTVIERDEISALTGVGRFRIG